eukprot:3516289-Rhodomonas_salina.1
MHLPVEPPPVFAAAMLLFTGASHPFLAALTLYTDSGGSRGRWASFTATLPSRLLTLDPRF